MDSASLNTITDTTSMKNPIDDYPFYVLIETSGSNASHDEEVYYFSVEIIKLPFIKISI